MHNEKLNNAFNDSMSLLLATPVDEQDHTPIRMAMIHPYTDTYIDTYLSIGMYCGRTVGFKSCVCTVYIQVCTSGDKKLQGPESKPAKQLRPFNLVEICQNTTSFAMKYCIVLSQWISERNLNFARLRHAQMIELCLLLCCMSL